MITLAAALLASAQLNCSEAVTQADMTNCAVRDFEVADAALNRRWKPVYAAMKARDAAVRTRGGGPGYASTTLEGQRAWLRYRDMQCSLEGLHYAGGSLQPMVVARCRERLTLARTAELKSLMWDD